MVNNTGVRRVALGDIPIEVRGQVQAVKAYEAMTVEAALSGDRRRALAALLSNPICHCHYQRTKALLDELLEANRASSDKQSQVHRRQGVYDSLSRQRKAGR
jgi:6-phospho-beta-glucosidase